MIDGICNEVNGHASGVKNSAVLVGSKGFSLASK